MIQGERTVPKKLVRRARLTPRRSPSRRSPATGGRATGRTGEIVPAERTGCLEMELVAIIVPGEEGLDSMSAVVDSIDATLEEFSVFDSAPEAVHVFTPEGLIRSSNEAFDELFDAPPGVYIGQHVTLLNPGSVERNYRLLEEILDETRTNGAWKGILTHRRWDGMEFTSRALVYPMWAAGERYLVCFQSRPEDPGGKAATAA
jgi:hypothetical protein